MGVTYASAIIRNAAEPEEAWEGVFLVDSGATDSLVPRQHLEAIGLKPRGRRMYEMADGSEIAMDVTTAEVEIMGEIVGTRIVYGESRHRAPARCDGSPIGRDRLRSAQRVPL